MTLDMLREKGIPPERQAFTWRELAGPPYSKLDDDAYTRIRVLLMNGIEAEAVRFGHACARVDRDLRRPLALIRRAEQHQQTVTSWLNPPDQSPLETTIGLEQVATEVTASVAQNEPDPHLAGAYRVGLLDHLDHLYRFAALMDRVEGKDANAILQSYTEIRPGRPTAAAHRHPHDDLREPYERARALAVSKLNALTMVASEHQAHDYYMAVGPQLADPVARGLYAEIASVEEQHVTQYESLVDPDETLLEKWLLHEACEVYCYWCCLEQEPNPHVQKIWDRFLAYELGHLHFVADLMRRIERRDPAELLPGSLPRPIRFDSQRLFIRRVLREEVRLRARGGELVAPDQESDQTIEVREQLGSEGVPSEIAAAGYRWRPGSELVERAGAEGMIP